MRPVFHPAIIEEVGDDLYAMLETGDLKDYTYEISINDADFVFLIDGSMFKMGYRNATAEESQEFEDLLVEYISNKTGLEMPKVYAN